MNDSHDARDGHLPELAAALQHLAGRRSSSHPNSPEGHTSLTVTTVTRARHAARTALAHRLAALLAEVAGRCQPTVVLLAEDIGPEQQRLPSELQDEARRLAGRLGITLPAELWDPLPDESVACRARLEAILHELTALEGDSVRVTDARLRLGRRS